MTSLDSSVMETSASISATILVGVLVFSSVLELVKTSDTTKFSLLAAELKGSVKLVVSLVQAVVVLSFLGSAASLLAILISEQWLRLTALGLTGISSLLFAVLATVTIQLLWKRQS